MEGSNRPLVIDTPAKQLAELFATEKWQARSAQSVLALLQRACGSVGYPTEEIDGPTAAEYLERLIDVVTRELIGQVGGYSAARWLWYLRRLPDSLFEGTYKTTLGYDRALAEAVSWHSTRIEHSTSEKYFAFRVDASACRHLADFVSAVRLLSHLHSTFRRIGKGAFLFFEGSMPFARQSDDVADAIVTYDTRHERRQEVSLASLGLAKPVMRLDAIAESQKSLVSHVFIFVPCSPMQVPVSIPSPEGGNIEANVLARHIFTPVPVESFLNPYSGLTSQELPFLGDIEPLILLHMLIPAILAELPAALSNMLQFGYCVVSPSRLERLFAAWLPAVCRHLHDIAPMLSWSDSYEEWRRRCGSLTPSSWPLRSGGFIRESDTAIMLDVSASSSTLLNRAVVERSDFDLANIRGNTFEVQVQRIVDETAWRPDPTLAVFRGRTLRSQGRGLTDIDAIACCNGTLLLISCKSAIYDADYDKGTYRVITNVKAMADNAVTKWLQFVDDLKAKPIGDNFDFSSFREIIGIVCTPYVVYSDDRVTLDFVKPGLRRCVAAFELRQWLEESFDKP